MLQNQRDKVSLRIVTDDYCYHLYHPKVYCSWEMMLRSEIYYPEKNKHRLYQKLWVCLAYLLCFASYNFFRAVFLSNHDVNNTWVFLF